MPKGIDLSDAPPILSLALASAGAALVWEIGVGMMVFGGVLFALTLLASRHDSPRPPSPPAVGRS